PRPGWPRDASPRRRARNAWRAKLYHASSRLCTRSTARRPVAQITDLAYTGRGFWTHPGGRRVAQEKTELIEILRKMVMIREFDLLAIELRKARRIYGALHPYVGEEAVAVGVCAALAPTDRITSTHRGHGHCIAKGADINRMMAELFGRVDGYCKGKGGSMHIADFAIGMLGANGIVAGGMPIACGAALAAQLEDAGKVTACFFGDGATGEGEFHETLNIASLWKLPLLFVCENNRYGAGNAVESLRAQADITLHAPAYWMPGSSATRSSATPTRRWPSPRQARIPIPTTCWSTCSPNKECLPCERSRSPRLSRKR